ncbi:MAG: hypothetical protein HY666_06015 [Chloroflexi bacterium]|nr:hypothetical protein [Chloroflexota bacterium]
MRMLRVGQPSTTTYSYSFTFTYGGPSFADNLGATVSGTNLAITFKYVTGP